MGKKNIIIAIDGEASSGKGTMAKLLAKSFNFAYLDTGLIYRAVSFLAKTQNVLTDKEKIISIAQSLKPVDFLPIELKSDEIAQVTSKIIAGIPEVRASLLNFQRTFGNNPKDENGIPLEGAILDGRDIGTVIFPDADIKFFVTASLEERAQRRYLELKKNNLSITYEETYNSLKSRDETDKSRPTGALKLAQDAILVDTTGKTIDEVFNIMSSYIKNKIK
jgi:cytidylate kinase